MTYEDTQRAIAQLRQSERGSDCLDAFITMWHDRGSGLDQYNWRALETLCKAMRDRQLEGVKIIEQAQARSR
jgi:hypothetical protein